MPLGSHDPHSPAFGEADLSNCEREPIHLPGSIQPHGALLVAREPDLVIIQASRNAAEFLGDFGPMLGRSLEDLGGDLARRVRPYLADPLTAIPATTRCHLGRPERPYDALLHRPPEGGLIIELERAAPPLDVSRHIGESLRAILACASLRGLCDETARLFKDLTGYDRVMVYRFDDKGHGEVYSERREPDLEPYLGNWYPATDIPEIARRLYERNRVRLLVDVAATPVPLEPRRSPLGGAELDMSLCFLRSISPIHIQYLKNMGVAATLVSSLVVGGRLWGLVACHHQTPRPVPYELRALCELLGEAVATRIAALESFTRSQAELSVRRLEQRMIEAIARDGDWKTALFDQSQTLLQPLDADGAALLFEERIFTTGEVPGTSQLRAIAQWLDGAPRPRVFATASLGLDVPEFTALTTVASGLLAAPVSQTPGEYLLWFRRERVRTVAWGGNPFTPMVIGKDPSELSPRSSFARWYQLVEGTAEPWTLTDLAAARLIGESVADVVQQFRAVRLLIAQDQLTQVSRQVRQFDQPVVIADAGGRLLLINAAFEALAGTRARQLHRLEELPPLFSRSAEVRYNLHELLRHRRPWRGEVALEALPGSLRPLLVRADPVFSAPDRVLGFVLLFTDLTERKTAEAARRRFQEGILEPHQAMRRLPDSRVDLVYRDLLAAVVGNAQLAALEITDGVEPAHMPELLESVRASVARAAELLEHLVRHASSDGEPDRGE